MEHHASDFESPFEEDIAATNASGRSTQIKRFVFTVNNWTPAEHAAVKVFLDCSCVWGIVAPEIAPTTGTPHLQGACVLKKKTAFSTLRKVPGLLRARMAKMKGTPLSNQVYCRKAGVYSEYGTPPNPGKRSDLLPVVQSIKAGKSMLDIVSDDTAAVVFVKYQRGLTALRNLTRERRKLPPQVFWFYGPTGSGKSRAAFELAINKFGGRHWCSSADLSWYDGYDGQELAILDDFRPGAIKFRMLLRILDRWPLSVPIKGSYTEWTPSIIIITCPLPYNELYRYRQDTVPEDLTQLKRRITESIQFPDQWESTGKAIFYPEEVIVPDTPPAGFPALDSPCLLSSESQQESPFTAGQSSSGAFLSGSIFGNPVQSPSSKFSKADSDIDSSASSSCGMSEEEIARLTSHPEQEAKNNEVISIESSSSSTSTTEHF